MNYFRALKPALLGLTLAVAGTCVSHTASAQSAAAGFAEMNIHDYLHRDVVLIAQALGMDEGQKVIVESLYEDYRADFDAGWARTQQRFADMREDLQSADREQIMNMVLAPFENWQKEKAQIKNQFEQNVRVILNTAQLERWPAFERQMLREKTLHYGRLSGESLNLFHVLRDLRLSDRQRMQIDPIMEQYDLALHQAITQRNAALREAQNAMMRSIRNPEQTHDISRTRDEVNRRVAIRNVNDLYIEEIASSLPSEFASQFRHDALERAYPRVFRALPAERVFVEALKLTHLDEETLAQIQSMQTAMLDEFQGINVQLHQGVRDHEPKAMINQAEIAAARQAGGEVNRLTDPNLVHYRKRDERANYYMTQLRELLGVEQFASLPGASRWVPQRRAEVAESDTQRTIRGEERRDRNGRIIVTPEGHRGVGGGAAASPNSSPRN